MAANRLDPMAAAAELTKPSTGAEAAPATDAKGGGLSAWLPLILTVLLMPALAYVTTTYVLAPKLAHSLGGPAPAGAEGTAGGEAAAASAAKTTTKVKQYATLDKVLVNVAGTMGSRYLIVSLTVVSTRSDFPTTFKSNEAELRHVAIGSLGSKTIADLEKPGSKNVLRAELTSLFNTVLGNGVVQELFFTEFAIQ
ncbi:MAG: flagellar basal body-associated FliL family protein [Verrucomicrobia bacterium]|nr:flagellar basal body-associated FliL family protein [Verrucomicrobiota bacterium]